MEDYHSPEPKQVTGSVGQALREAVDIKSAAIRAQFAGALAEGDRLKEDVIANVVNADQRGRRIIEECLRLADEALQRQEDREYLKMIEGAMELVAGSARQLTGSTNSERARGLATAPELYQAPYRSQTPTYDKGPDSVGRAYQRAELIKKHEETCARAEAARAQAERTAATIRTYFAGIPSADTGIRDIFGQSALDRAAKEDKKNRYTGKDLIKKLLKPFKPLS